MIIELTPDANSFVVVENPGFEIVRLSIRIPSNSISNNRSAPTSEIALSVSSRTPYWSMSLTYKLRHEISPR